MYFVIVAGFLLKQSVLAAFLSDFLQQKENISFLVFFYSSFFFFLIKKKLKEIQNCEN
jgi:hypothetical protein